MEPTIEDPTLTADESFATFYDGSGRGLGHGPRVANAEPDAVSRAVPGRPPAPARGPSARAAGSFLGRPKC
jgi:hypothetical protein